MEFTERVFTMKLALVRPEATLTLAGTEADEVLLESVTEIPPAGAGTLSVTVPVEGLPPVTVVGFSDSEAKATATGLIVSDAVWLTPL